MTTAMRFTPAELRFIADRVRAEVAAHLSVGPLLTDPEYRRMVERSARALASCKRGHMRPERYRDGRCIACVQERDWVRAERRQS